MSGGKCRSGRHRDGHHFVAIPEVKLAPGPLPHGIRAALARYLDFWTRSRKCLHINLWRLCFVRTVSEPPAVSREFGRTRRGLNIGEGMRFVDSLKRLYHDV